MRALFIAFIPFILFSSAIFSQSKKIDSLSAVLKNSKEDTNKVNALNGLAKEFRNLKPDTTIALSKSAIGLSEKLGYNKGIAEGYLWQGTSLVNRGNFDEAEKCLAKSIKMNVVKWITAQSYNNLGNLFYEKGNYPDAITNYLEGLKIREQMKDIKGIANAYNGLGSVYANLGNYPEALNYHFKSLKMKEEIGDRYGMAMSKGNIGLIYLEEGRAAMRARDFRLANEKLGKAMDNFVFYMTIAGEMGQKHGLGHSYKNIAAIYGEQAVMANVPSEKKKLFSEALHYDFLALDVNKEIGEKNNIISTVLGIAAIYMQMENYSEAEKYLLQVVDQAGEVGHIEYLKQACERLSKIYGKQGKYKKQVEYYQYFIAARDSLYNIESTKKEVQAQLQYDFSKKQTADSLKVEEERKINEVKFAGERKQRYALWGGLALVLVFAGIMFNRFKVTSKQKQIIEAKEKETQIKNSIINEQKNLVEEKQKEIVDSITYARRIQYSLLAHADFLKDNLPEHFIYFHPKDIVSGDFYWATKHNNKFYLAVCDSTGHGVPGAFMSLLNIGFLSEAINEKGIEKPNEIFNYVRKRLEDTISKEGQRDGFDGILVSFDQQSEEITYAAANNSPVLIHNSELDELGSDRMPVGIGERKEDFKLYAIKRNKGDILYLYTDGFADQFGGPKGKKFKYKALNELILSNSTHSVEQQKDVLNTTFENWKGNLEQVDDVCVIGIRL